MKNSIEDISKRFSGYSTGHCGKGLGFSYSEGVNVSAPPADIEAASSLSEWGSSDQVGFCVANNSLLTKCGGFNPFQHKNSAYEARLVAP